MAGTVTLFWFIFVGLLAIILGTFAWAGISAAPWVPLWKRDVRRMLRLAQTKPDELVYDLGAGDGRIIIIAAREFRARSVGFEMAVLPYLVGYCRIVGGRPRPRLKFRNFYHQDLSQADVICAFLSPQAMAKLKTKFETETKPGCRIVSYAFSIPGWPPTKIDKPNAATTAIYLYQR